MLRNRQNLFRRLNVELVSNPTCSKAVNTLAPEDFLWYDKDGFELNKAEYQFYQAMGHPIDSPILNHTCWQEPWFELEDTNVNLLIDHAMVLCRCDYIGEAREQLEEFKKTVPYADLLLKTKTKWGFDFALDAIQDGEVFELIHIEYDHTDYDSFSKYFINFEYLIHHTDWTDCAKRVWDQRDQWRPLKGFEQNNWKSKYLIGWDRAEHIEKAI